MKCLVTGGNGFLGRYIVEMLLERGDEVISLGRSPQPELHCLGVTIMQGDICDKAFLLKACKGVDVVFHTAAMAEMWGKWEDFYAINVTGTVNIIDACRKNNVERLIYTSSPSVVFGQDDLENVNEETSYPEQYLAFYPHTKALAEKKVLEENGKGLLTCALRPHLIFGPRDNHLLPRVLDRARAGKLKVVGAGKNLVDVVYVENAAKAHIDAADHLFEGSQACGSAYFISQGEPVNLWSWINDILISKGIKPVKKSVSYWVAFRIGTLLEILYALLRIAGEPPMTRFIASQLAKSHYFDISRARKEIGYSPSIDTKTGLRITLDSL